MVELCVLGQGFEGLCGTLYGTGWNAMNHDFIDGSLSRGKRHWNGARRWVQVAS